MLQEEQPAAGSAHSQKQLAIRAVVAPQLLLSHYSQLQAKLGSPQSCPCAAALQCESLQPVQCNSKRSKRMESSALMPHHKVVLAHHLPRVGVKQEEGAALKAAGGRAENSSSEHRRAQVSTGVHTRWGCSAGCMKRARPPLHGGRPAPCTGHTARQADVPRWMGNAESTRSAPVRLLHRLGVGRARQPRLVLLVVVPAAAARVGAASNVQDTAKERNTLIEPVQNPRPAQRSTWLACRTANRSLAQRAKRVQHSVLTVPPAPPLQTAAPRRRACRKICRTACPAAGGEGQCG